MMSDQHAAEEDVASEKPQPVRHCACCANLATQRRLAQANGEASKVANLDVRLRSHLRTDHGWVSGIG